MEHSVIVCSWCIVVAIGWCATLIACIVLISALAKERKIHADTLRETYLFEIKLREELLINKENLSSFRSSLTEKIDGIADDVGYMRELIQLRGFTLQSSIQKLSERVSEIEDENEHTNPPK